MDTGLCEHREVHSCVLSAESQEIVHQAISTHSDGNRCLCVVCD